MTLNIMADSIAVVQSVVLLSAVYAECCYAECCYAECCYAEWLMLSDDMLGVVVQSAVTACGLC
jgi:hypothetical protein